MLVMKEERKALEEGRRKEGRERVEGEFDSLS